MEICSMTEQDLNQVVTLEQQIFSVPWTRQGFLDALKRNDTCYLVAKEQGEICGYCGFYQSFEEADIVNVAVAPKYRQRGIGRKLLEQLLFAGRQKGVQRFLLEVRISNVPAIALYTSMGFALDGTRKGFYDKPKEDAYLFSKTDSISH